MRILHVIPSLIKGGAERLALDIVRKLNTLTSVESSLIYFNDINDYAKEYEDVDTQLMDAKVQPSIVGKWTVDLTEWENLLDNYQPDIIHSHLFAADLLSRYAVRKNIHYFSHCHDNMHQLRSLQTDFSLSKARITDLYERHFIIDRYRTSKNTFISISPDTTSYFRKNLPSDLSSNIIELANAINTEKFAQNTAEPQAVGQSLRILNVGSFVPKKNQTLLIDIAIQLKQLDIDFEIRFAGDGPEMNRIKQRVQLLELDKRVIFLGNVENIEREMWKSHLYVHTAKYEPFGLVLLEAMAAGLPVISLDGRGNRDLVRNGDNGFFIEEQSPTIFAKKILELKNNPVQWKAFRNSGLEFVKKFDIQTYVLRLLEIYEKRL